LTYQRIPDACAAPLRLHEHAAEPGVDAGRAGLTAWPAPARLGDATGPPPAHIEVGRLGAFLKSI